MADFQIEDAVKKVMADKGLKTKDMLKKISMSTPGYYRMMKNGTMTVSVLLEMAEALDVHPSAFFQGYEGEAIAPAPAKGKKGNDKLWKELLKSKEDAIKTRDALIDELRKRLELLEERA